MFRSFCVAICFVCSCSRFTQADDWDRFRGPHGTGVAAGQTLPQEIGTDKSVAWKAALPAGTSSPVIVGEKLFITSHTKGDRTLHCLNAMTGESLWTQTVQKDHDEIATAPAGPSTPTPATDGKAVYVFFPDAGLFAWSLDGVELWKQPTPVSTTMHGLSGSLIVHDGRLFHLVDQLSDSHLTAYDAASGQQVWKQERVCGITGGYSTPVVYSPKEGDAQLITTGPLEVVAYNVTTGDRVWWVVGKSNAPVSSPMLIDDRVYVCEPVGEPLPMSMLAPLDRNKDSILEVKEATGNEAIRRLLVRIDENWGDKNEQVNEDEWNKAWESLRGKGGLACIDVTGRGDVTETHVKWTFGKAVPYIPSALANSNWVMTVDDGGIVTVVDRESGKQLEKVRLKQGNGQYYASPVAVDDRVVVIDTKGVVNFVASGTEWKSTFTCELGEPCFATPAIAHNRLYVRTATTLYCFGS
jgi:outer membrane protein assembly factor BamB